MSKLIKCKACGKEISKTAKKCPECGHDNRNFFMKHKIITGIIAIAIIGGAAAAGGNQPKKVGENNTAASTSSAADSSKSSKNFKVGDVIQLKDYKISVNKVYVVNGDEFSKPKDGNEFLAVDCTIENISKEEQTVSSLMMFKVVDKDGRACDYSLMGQTAAKAGQLDGTVGAGRKLTGVYVVEVPKGQTGLELEFDSSLFTGGQVVVKLN